MAQILPADLQRVISTNKNYRINQNCDLFTVNYQRVWYSPLMLIPLYIFGFIYSLLIFWVGGNLHGYILLAIFLAPAIYLFINIIRRDGAFAVSGKAVIIRNRVYPKSEISEVYLKEAKGFFGSSTVTSTRIIYNPRSMGSTIAAHSHMLGAALDNIGNETRQQLSAHFVEANYQVGIIIEGRYVKLAGGLNYTIATELFNKVQQLLREF